jgi:NAD(P)-dependent dehydrogenase (short-subunit alcohol dehydrogenase family)
MRLKDKVIIVTGAASGIGASAVRLFVAEGTKVVATDVEVDRLEALAAGLAAGQGASVAFYHNVSSEADWRRVVSRAVETFGRVEVPVDNSGVSERQPVPLSTAETTEESDWDRLAGINLKGPVSGSNMCCR